MLGLVYITKGQLQNMLGDKQQSRMLGHLLMSIGRDVRSTPMAWASEGKKLDAAVKHLAWQPHGWNHLKAPLRLSKASRSH